MLKVVVLVFLISSATSSTFKLTKRDVNIDVSQNHDNNKNGTDNSLVFKGIGNGISISVVSPMNLDDIMSTIDAVTHDSELLNDNLGINSTDDLTTESFGTNAGYDITDEPYNDSNDEGFELCVHNGQHDCDKLKTSNDVLTTEMSVDDKTGEVDESTKYQINGNDENFIRPISLESHIMKIKPKNYRRKDEENENGKIGVRNGRSRNDDQERILKRSTTTEEPDDLGEIYPSGYAPYYKNFVEPNTNNGTTLQVSIAESKNYEVEFVTTPSLINKAISNKSLVDPSINDAESKMVNQSIIRKANGVYVDDITTLDTQQNSSIGESHVKYNISSTEKSLITEDEIPLNTKEVESKSYKSLVVNKDVDESNRYSGRGSDKRTVVNSTIFTTKPRSSEEIDYSKASHHNVDQINSSLTNSSPANINGETIVVTLHLPIASKDGKEILNKRRSETVDKSLTNSSFDQQIRTNDSSIDINDLIGTNLSSSTIITSKTSGNIPSQNFNVFVAPLNLFDFTTISRFNEKESSHTEDPLPKDEDQQLSNDEEFNSTTEYPEQYSTNLEVTDTEDPLLEITTDVIDLEAVNFTNAFNSSYSNLTETDAEPILIDPSIFSQETWYWRKSFIASCVVASVPFLAATLLVFWILPQLNQSDHGKSIICYLLSVMVGYSVLAVTLIFGQSLGSMCAPLGYVLHYCILAISAWLNIMCLDILCAFSVLEKRTEVPSKFKLYSFYAWLLPLAVVTITYGLSYAPLPEKYLPAVGGELCFLETELKQLIYCHGPNMVLTTANVLMFIATAVVIMMHTRQTSILSSANSARTRAQRRWFRLYTKLFMVMGMNWVAELLSFVLDFHNGSIFFLITDTTNCLIGVIIFIIYVCRRRVLNQLKKWWNGEDMIAGRRRSAFASTLTRFREELLRSKFGSSIFGFKDVEKNP